jgi:hypothetical protein
VGLSLLDPALKVELAQLSPPEGVFGH